MPNYRYRAAETDSGCPHCSDVFEVLQALSEPPLAECPSCEAKVRRVIGRSECLTNARYNEKKTLSDGNLKRLGFKKLVKEGDGKYRNVLAD